ncbi:MAG: YfiM family protein [Bacteroidetes bacterium]|nr:YfiM family protein [Bacteroidota bacterium]
MKKIYLIIFLIFFCNYFCCNAGLGYIFASNNDTNSFLNKEYLIASNDEIVQLQENVLADEISNDETKNIKYIDEKDFWYADTKMSILIGGLPQAETKIKPIPTAILTAGLTGAFILQHQLQMKTIWKNNKDAYFKFQDDLKEELFVDKLGHFYGAYITSYFLREALVGCGFGWESSNNIAAILGLTYSTYVEIWDGFGPDYGFSPSDFIADILGAAFFSAQHYHPSLRNITPKFIYIPSEWTGYKSRIPNAMFIDDYSSQFFFYSVNIHNLLPDKWKTYYPSWLELSVGYTVRNMLDKVRHPEEEPCNECTFWKEGYWGSPRIVLALDYNLEKILPDGGNTWNWFRQTLNRFKLPSPALEIGTVTRFYILFPFKLW